MWSNFTDFALKAQKDLQDQANEAAAKLQQFQQQQQTGEGTSVLTAPPAVVNVSSTINSFFNLDSMQQQSKSTNENNDNNNIVVGITKEETILPPILQEQEQQPVDEKVVTKLPATHVTSSMIDSGADTAVIEEPVTSLLPADTTDLIIETSTKDVTQHENASLIVVLDDVENVEDTNTSEEVATTIINNSGIAYSTNDTITSSTIEPIDKQDNDSTAAAAVIPPPSDLLETEKMVDNEDLAQINISTPKEPSLLIQEEATTLESTPNHTSSIDSLVVPDVSSLTSNNSAQIVSLEERIELPTNRNDKLISIMDTSVFTGESKTDDVADVGTTMAGLVAMDESDRKCVDEKVENENCSNQMEHLNSDDNHEAIEQTSPRTIDNVTTMEIQQQHPPPAETPKNMKLDTNSERSNVTISYPMTPSPIVGKVRPTKKLLVLISNFSIDRQVKVRQDLTQMALAAAEIDYEIIDGSDSTNKSNIALRNELFALSGLRGVYPQFFIVNLLTNDGDDKGTTFWGTFDQFQHVNDDGQLRNVFAFDNAMDSSENNPLNRTLYPSAVSSNVAETSVVPSSEAAGPTAVPVDAIYEKFTHQIQRIEENYQMERNETEQRHKNEMQQQQILIQQAELIRREMEEKMLRELKQKDEQLQEVLQRNEGYRLKLDVLKREVTGTQELVQARDAEIQKYNQKYLNDLRAMEKQFNAAEKNAAKYKEEVQSLQTKLDKVESELVISRQEYDTMKDRAKSIATELKDRRAECRQLELTIDEIQQQNRYFQEKIDSLQEKLNHQGLNQTDKDREIQTLQAKIIGLNQQLSTIEKEWQDKVTKSETVLAEYKKRAQHSLSMSNARTAAAVQAREEAELDARAARSTADAALERSIKADLESREAIAKTKVAIESMKKERDAAIQDLEQLKEQLSANISERLVKERELQAALDSQMKKDLEIKELAEIINSADCKIASLQQKNMESTSIIEDLRQELSAAREEIQRTSVIIANLSSQNEVNGKKGMNYTPTPALLNGGGSYDVDEVDDTIAALRLELQEANDAIEDLKTALKNAIEMNERQDSIATAESSNANSTTQEFPYRTDTDQHGSSSETGSIPLFYAMEKQAELKTARTEMNRLASLLADVQSEKMEAYEAMEEMRRKLDEADARLKRNEKLGMTNSSSPNNVDKDSSNASAVNIEYLKHILLRYMNAKSNVERKTLVPVIGAVLELTPDEVQAATQNLESNSNTIVGNGAGSLFGFLS